MEHWDAPCLCAPLNDVFSPGHQRGFCSAQCFPSEYGMDCIIDNTVIYLYFLGYSKQLSLFELNILCTGSVLLSSVGWSSQWSAWFLVQLRGLGMSPGNLTWPGGSYGQELGIGSSRGTLVCAGGLGPGAWELGCAPCMKREPEMEQQSGNQGLLVGTCLLCWKGCGRLVGTGDSLSQKLH